MYTVVRYGYYGLTESLTEKELVVLGEFYNALATLSVLVGD